MSDMISLKISTNNGNKRRLNVPRDITFETINDTMKDMLPTSNGDLHWRYVDEENELIDISTNHEWSLAVRSIPYDTLMRLFIEVTPKPVQPSVQSQDAPQMFGTDGGFDSRIGRIAVPVLLFWGIITHPIMTAIALATTAYVTFHHYPTTFNTLSIQAQKHWRKIGAFYTLSLLFSCRLCTIFFALPLLLLAYKKLGVIVRRNRPALVGGAKYFVRQASAMMTDVQEKAKQAAEQILASVIESANEKIQAPVVQPTAPAQPEVFSPVSCQDSIPSAPSAELYPELPTFEEQEMEGGEFLTQASTLSELGFKNYKLNIHLLKNFNGDIDKVINSLLSLSAM